MTIHFDEIFAVSLVARMLVKVEEFNKSILALPIPSEPQVLNEQRRVWASGAILEELHEFAAASDTGDVEEAADALIDLIYFALGRLVEMGVPAVAVMDAVHDANMTKIQGELAKRPGSLGYDAVKPEGWTAPDHAWLLDFTLTDLKELRRLRAMHNAGSETNSPVWQHLQALRHAKGQDYNNVPGGRDAYFPFGHFSYAHMIHTKNLRIQSLLRAMANGQQPNFEGLLDTVEDLVNYATYYAEALREGKLEQEVITLKGGPA